MMYQLPIDMMMRMMNVPFVMKSPVLHIASMPYGFSTLSFEVVAAGGGAFGAAGAASAGLAGSAAGACAWAVGDATSMVTAGAHAMTKAAMSAGSRLISCMTFSFCFRVTYCARKKGGDGR